MTSHGVAKPMSDREQDELREAISREEADLPARTIFDLFESAKRLLATIDALKAQRDAAAELLSEAAPGARGFGPRLTREQMIGLVARIKDPQLHDQVGGVTSELLGCRATIAELRERHQLGVEAAHMFDNDEDEDK